ncbi:MAG: (2Fe-2S)-binding protein, partial [Deltaproteobacteria bacterium]|nr:(2Fe-2S)-binding protein [Deltaproteobacteria bacterium]
MAKSKVKIEIDGKKLSVLSGTTILKAAGDAEITIPTLCHRPDL